MKYVVWGHGRSWIVNAVNELGVRVGSSHWMSTKDEAEQNAQQLRDGERRAA